MIIARFQHFTPVFFKATRQVGGYIILFCTVATMHHTCSSPAFSMKYLLDSKTQLISRQRSTIQRLASFEHTADALHSNDSLPNNYTRLPEWESSYPLHFYLRAQRANVKWRMRKSSSEAPRRRV